MLIRKKITALIFGLVSVIFLLPNLASAQLAEDFGTDALSGLVTASGSRDLFDIVTGIINTALYFLGAIAVLLFLYAGWLWFSSRGNKDGIDKAKKIMISATIGLAIIFSSYAIVNWLFKDAIQRAFYDLENGTRDPQYGGGIGLGGGVIESHYPEPNAKGIPRNTNIYVTFKEPMKIDTIANVGSNDCTGTNPRTCPINTLNIRLHKASEPTVNLADIKVTYNPDDPKLFEFNPYGDATSGTYLLGEQTRDTKYQITLANVRTADDRQAFNFGSYSWYFTVGTYSDNTPPRVVSVRPKINTQSPRNTIVQVNFSEAVNPTLASGVVPGYSNIKLVYQDAAGTERSDAGRYVISNQYRTVEFIPSTLCAQNSCGLDVFCLTGPEDFVGTVTTNIKDMVGNALTADYVWNFQTLNTIDITAPKMVNMSPVNDFPLSQPVRMTFDETLMSSSINSTNIKLFKGANTPVNYWLRLGDADGKDNNLINIHHERFDVSTYYLATSTSGIMDSNQNCWYPCRCEGANCECDTVDSSGRPACDDDSCQIPAE